MSAKSSQEIEIKVPAVGESISEVFIGEWYIAEGNYVALDANVVGLETDKATFDVPATAGGIVSKVLKHAGESAAIGEVIGYLQPAEAPVQSAAAAAPTSSGTSASAGTGASAGAGAPGNSGAKTVEATGAGHVMPAAERMMAENKLPAGEHWPLMHQRQEPRQGRR